MSGKGSGSIKAYEYMNQFYVEEGNKRVSVLKYYGAVSVPGTVTRIIPRKTDEKENKIYYEFLDFYEAARINYIWFSKVGSFKKLQKAVGKEPDEKWDEEERLNFSSLYSRFELEYDAKGGERLPVTAGDAFLALLSVYDYQELQDMTTSDLRKLIGKTWEEFTLLGKEEDIHLGHAFARGCNAAAHKAQRTRPKCRRCCTALDGHLFLPRLLILSSQQSRDLEVIVKPKRYRLYCLPQ